MHTLNDILNAKKSIEKYESNRSDFTTAAAAGVIGGVILTAMSERSNALTVGISILAGAAYTANVSTNPEIGLYDSNASALAIVGGVGLGYTALVGAIGNHLIGSSNEKEQVYDV